MAKRRPPEEEEGGYNWMDTYGDMVTLLLTFFVLLFAFSSVDNEKWNTLVEAFTGSPPMRSIAAMDLLSMPNISEDLPSNYLNMDTVGLGFSREDDKLEELDIGITDEMLAGMPTEVLQQLQVVLNEEQKELISSEEYMHIEEEFSALYERLTVYIEQNGLEDMLYASRDMESIYLRVAAGVLFDSGRADILPDAMPMLDMLEDILFAAGDALDIVTVEGHTDTVPISSARYPSNWELSAARATSVARYIWEKERIPQAKFNVSGYGEFRPVADNETEEGKQQNRRVEFVLRKKVLTTEDIRRQSSEELDDVDVDIAGQAPEEADPAVTEQVGGQLMQGLDEAGATGGGAE